MASYIFRKLEADFEFQPTADDLRLFREWLKKTPWVVQDYDDEFLAAFIRGCKGSLEKSKRALENVNSMGLRFPDPFGHMDVFNKITQEHLSNFNLFLLPKRTEDGSLVIISSLKENKDPSTFHIFESQRYMLMSFYVIFWDRLFGSGKMIVIYDWKHVTATHLRELNPMYLQNNARILEDTIPHRLQGIHFINIASVLEWMFNLWKSCIKSKLAERIHVHSSPETLKNFIPAELLPKEYGGSNKDLATLNNGWKKRVESYGGRLKEESNKMRSLNHLRPKSNNFEEMVGTFRALNVD